ncbi:SigE family RNA polymerase sigma factor [Streptomyces sp. MS06]|uniref:SigE family RNA polymerase sigma factor n=1 Tax=Streptomyces sp. MS06 TaxID=3385974 RepID=UPI0039A00631
MREADDFDAFYAGSVRRLTGQMYAMTGSRTEAEDLVQEAFARAWQNWGKVSRYDDPEAWVRTVAHRLRVSVWRKAVNRLAAHRRRGPDDDVPGVGVDYVAVVAALRRIPAPQRRAIVLHHLVGLTVEEIARETGARPGTVKARLSRGRRAMAPHLTETTGEAGLPASAGAAAPARATGPDRRPADGRNHALGPTHKEVFHRD